MSRRELKARPVAKPTDLDDAALFRDAVGKVRRVHSDAAERRARPPAPIPRQTLADARAVVHESLHGPVDEAGWSEPLSYGAPGTSPEILRRLGRADFSVSDELDLHHMNAAAAKAAIGRFLGESRKSGRLCVRIVHGKGLRSAGDAPVLKNLVDRLLRQRADVLAFASAPLQQGGTGAVLVLLLR